ncbi:hypothetical protein [Clostridium saccharobutylicum]|uniref:Uncharacterized protein n=2 Tax=Clostridium saccharobutylicum TaxID=169679 RepID=U5MWA7_CLOSA|nr:hypothetical protein [Clostridium saccharobutylicum]AGX44870.1 hypothetical protein CLSA_c39100 [Clostridium saccharobutylicum DSM 13864]AQR92152.1 hypothetical protein CLOSC_38820 [Clostridium saccharobutylicum]AQS02054.1 hypothetical protein CSACC_38870 [Clostridium saccharobutylicum]AQS11658.1 hypothetical protein CLOBY_38160 [Clostridium saccharobutylicum]AQS16037.1 hypothetical protein CLOSACC_38870 [Clostridium saccharobutylicum]
MSLKDKLSSKFSNYFQNAYMQKYGDRITSVSGTVLSVKFLEKNYFIMKSLVIEMVIKPEVGKKVVKCWYKKNRWFKKPEFILVKQGHKVIIMGVTGEKNSKKENSQEVQIMNVLNLTTKKDLVPVDHSQIRKSRQQAMNMRR